MAPRSQLRRSRQGGPSFAAFWQRVGLASRFDTGFEALAREPIYLYQP